MSEQKKPRGLALIGKRVLEAVEGELPSVQSGAAPRTELAQRGAALSKLSGDVIYGQSEWIDPALCRPSELNARDYNALTYEDCADLIETIKSEGQQRTAATVRRTNDPDVPYEIIAGNRRHWSVSWLRANNYPEFRYLITVASMDDEAAFRWSDLENRARQDITDLERGRSYKMALESFYGNNKVHMADRLGISRRSLTRYIDLAELDPVLIEALGGHRQVSVMHAQEVKALTEAAEAILDSKGIT